MQRVCVGLILFTLSVYPSAAESQVGAFDRLGVGTRTPGESVQIDNGNLLLNAKTEQEIKIRRFGEAADPGSSAFLLGPTFRLGRVIIGGDGSPNFRVLYSDDRTPEATVLAFDSKGIVASVRNGLRGSHFEGFLRNGDTEPVFRLNSFPEMRLEFGPGGNSLTDVAIERCGRRCLDASSSILADDFVVRSSRQLKDEIELLGGGVAIDLLKTLSPITYVLKDDAANDRRIGLIAEDLPDLLKTPEHPAVSPMQLVTLLIRVVQQQQVRIEALEQAHRPR